MQNKQYSVINITGLVVGVSACLLITLVLRYEQSFDSYHQKKDNIYRVVRVGKSEKDREYSSGVPFPVTDGLRAAYPELQNAVTVFGENDVQVIVPGANGETLKKFKESNVLLAEQQFFQMFDFKVLRGNRVNALVEPNTVMLTQATANKYFGDWATAVGKTLKIGNNLIKVTGIIEGPKFNTDFPTDIIISYATLKKNVNMNDWVSISNNTCFVQLPANYPPRQDEYAAKGICKKKYATRSCRV